MKKIAYSIVTTVAIFALVTSGGGVHATESGSVERRLAADIERVLAAQSNEQALIPSGGDRVLESDADHLGMGADVPTVTSDRLVTVTLPSDNPSAATERVIGDLRVRPNAGHCYSTALKEREYGAFQALVHIESACAPTEYRFPVDVPNGGKLVLQQDGSVLVIDNDNREVGAFAAP